MTTWHDMARGWHKMWQKVAFSGAKMGKKGGVRGGSQKSPNFAHGGGNLGGVFFGGSRKTGAIKHGDL